MKKKSPRLRTKTNQKYFSEFVVKRDGSLEIKFVKKSIGLNQYARTWKSVDRKLFAKLLENRKIGI